MILIIRKGGDFIVTLKKSTDIPTVPETQEKDYIISDETSSAMEQNSKTNEISDSAFLVNTDN